MGASKRSGHKVSRSPRAFIVASASRLPRVTIAALVLAIATLAATYPAAALAPHGTGRGTGISATSQQRVPTAGVSDATAPQLSLAKQVGQLIIATYQGQTPPVSLLSAIRLGPCRCSNSDGRQHHRRNPGHETRHGADANSRTKKVAMPAY